MAEPVSPAWDDADARLGAAMREQRHARGMTLVQVAAAAGLSHPFLSQLERGLTRPSMRSLFQIAEALGTTQQALLAAAGTDSSVDLEQGGGARLLAQAPAGVAVTEFAAPPQDFGDYFRHDHAELLYVAAGTIEVEVREAGAASSTDGTTQAVRTSRTTRTTLGPRGSLGYPGGVDHRFRQVGPVTAIVLAVHGGTDA